MKIRKSVTATFQLLEHAGYDRQVVATRNMYPKETLELWGQVRFTDANDFNTVIQKRLVSRERRPLFLTIFPGNHRHASRVVGTLTNYARIDTVLILTGLAGPDGRTAAVSCAPIHWSDERTHHAQILPRLLKMIRLPIGTWHLPLSDPLIVTSAGFPYSDHTLTVYDRQNGRSVRTCTNGYLCFSPEEPTLKARLTRFLTFPEQ